MEELSMSIVSKSFIYGVTIDNKLITRVLDGRLNGLIVK